MILVCRIGCRVRFISLAFTKTVTKRRLANKIQHCPAIIFPLLLHTLNTRINNLFLLLDMTKRKEKSLTEKIILCFSVLHLKKHLMS